MLGPDQKQMEENISSTSLLNDKVEGKLLLCDAAAIENDGNGLGLLAVARILSEDSGLIRED